MNPNGVSGDARSQLRRLGEYLINFSTDQNDFEDSLAGLAIPLPADRTGPSRTNDLIKLARLAKREYVQRNRRARYFEGNLFADPAWDILLDLFIGKIAGLRLSITSVCIASQVPSTTALRWIKQLEGEGLLLRTDDTTDHRRSFIELTDRAFDAMAAYFREFEQKMNDFSQYDVVQKFQRNPIASKCVGSND